jgi:hypothetical protein
MPSAGSAIGSNQFGAIPKSSTTEALVSMIHEWEKATSAAVTISFPEPAILGKEREALG